MFAALFPILGITFIDILGFSIMLPILPYYVVHFGASTVVVGILFSTFAFCQFIAGPVWGNVSDRIGRKRVLIISQIGATIGWTGLAFAPTLGWVFVARIIEGISGGNVSVTQAYVADRVPPEDRARAFGYVGAAFSAGFVLGPAAGGLLFAHFGYVVPFLLAAGLQAVTLVTTIYLLPETLGDRGETEVVSPAAIVRFLGNRDVAPVLVQRLLGALGLFAWFSVYALVLKSVAHFGAAETSYAFAVLGVFSVAFQLGVVGRLVSRFGVRRTSNIGFAAGCLFFIAVPFIHDTWTILASQVLFAFATSITNVTLVTLLSATAAENVRGTVLGVGSALDSVAGVAMPTLATAVLATYGPPWTGAISALFFCIALVLGLAAERKHG